MLYIRGGLDDELDFDMRQLSSEKCALAAAINLPVASQFVYDCLALQVHRGEKAAGIVSLNRRVHERKRRGPVTENFAHVDYAKRLNGSIAIGHNRYATAGSHDSVNNIQPLKFDSKFGTFYIAHNGELVNSQQAKSALMDQGVTFMTDSDTEIFGHMIGRSNEKNIEDAIMATTKQIQTSYSFLIMTDDGKVIGLRDKFGVRPLSIAQMSGGHLMCSENYTFDQYREAEFLRDVRPGEMVMFQKGEKDFKSFQFADPQERHCAFEGIYFASPRSKYNGVYHEDFRAECGKELIRENPGLKPDCIVPILDSGKQAARGVAEELGGEAPYKEYFLRIHKPPRANIRSFTSATDGERRRAAYQKLHLKKEKIQGKHIAVVDDSIVRGHTTKIISKRLRDAGASKVTILVAAPPIIDICPNGIDIKDRDRLVARAGSAKEIADTLGADQVIYLSPEGLEQVNQRTYKAGLCTGCFGGEYPIRSTEFE